MTTQVAPIWRGGRGPLAFLPPLLFRQERPWLTIGVAWLFSAAGSLAIGYILSLVLGGEGIGPALGDVSPLVLFLGLAVFSPIVETLMMAAVLTALLRVLRGWQAVVASAILWGVLHSLLAPAWGAVIWWPFLIFSTVFVTWRSRGFLTASAMAAAVHIAQNSLPSVLIILS